MLLVMMVNIKPQSATREKMVSYLDQETFILVIIRSLEELEKKRVYMTQDLLQMLLETHISSLSQQALETLNLSHIRNMDRILIGAQQKW